MVLFSLIFITTSVYALGVNLINPSDEATLSNPDVTFNCSAVDESGLQNITLYTNISGVWNAEETNELGGTNNYTTFLINNISNGSYQWNCLAYNINSSFKFSSHNHTFSIGNDTDDPSFALLNPANNSVDADGSILFSYNVTDNSSAIENCSLIINGIVNKTDYHVNEGVAQSFLLTGVTNGNYNWYISCYDNSDNFNNGLSQQQTFSVADTTAPKIFLLKPDMGYVDKDGVVLFEYKVKDYAYDIASCSLIINGTLNQTNSNISNMSQTQNFSVSGLTYGVYKWNVNCTDTAPNATNQNSSKKAEFVVNKKPIVTLNSSAYNTTNDNGDIVFNYTVQDDGLIRNCTLYNNINGWKAVQSNTFVQQDVSLYFTAENVPNGNYQWNIYCYDDARNPSEVKGSFSNWLFNVNKVAPTVSTIPELFWGEDDILILNLSNYFSDEKGDDLSYTAEYSNNVTVIIDNETKIVILESDKNWFGNISIIFTAFDEHGSNVSSNNVTFTVFEEGDTKPRFTSTTPTNNSVDADGYIFFECNAIDDYGLTNMSLYSNRTGTLALEEKKELTGLTNSTIFNITGLMDGFYEWACLAYDNANQQKWSEAYIVNVSIEAELTQHFPTWIVNNVNTSRYVTISYSSYLNNSLTLGNLTIYESDGELYFDKNISDYKFEAGSLMIHPQKVNITPDDVFDNNFTVGNTAGLNISITYYYNGSSYELKDNVTIEVVNETQW